MSISLDKQSVNFSPKPMDPEIAEAVAKAELDREASKFQEFINRKREELGKEIGDLKKKLENHPANNKQSDAGWFKRMDVLQDNLQKNIASFSTDKKLEKIPVNTPNTPNTPTPTTPIPVALAPVVSTPTEESLSIEETAIKKPVDMDKKTAKAVEEAECDRAPDLFSYRINRIRAKLQMDINSLREKLQNHPANNKQSDDWFERMDALQAKITTLLSKDKNAGYFNFWGWYQ